MAILGASADPVKAQASFKEKGKIEHVWDNVKAKGHAAEVLAVASQGNGKAQAAVKRT